MLKCKTIGAIALTLMLVIPSTPALAAESSAKLTKSSNLVSAQEYDVNSKISNELTNFVKKNKLNVKLENFNFKVSPEEINKPSFKSDVNKYINNVKISLLSTKYRKIVEKSDSNPNVRSFVDHGSYYTAEVWCGVPNIGHGYVMQDFKAKIVGNQVTSCTLMGQSYLRGLTLGSWTPIRSWYSIYGSTTGLDINMKGTVQYGYKGILGSYDATFLQECKISGKRLVDAY